MPIEIVILYKLTPGSIFCTYMHMQEFQFNTTATIINSVTREENLAVTVGEREGPAYIPFNLSWR